MNIAIVNGPNLNLTGSRETEIYGQISFESHLEKLQKHYPNHEFQYYQSNIEGELITALQNFGFYKKADAIVLNAGGYSHTSVAIADAVKASKVPIVIVHISNIYAREGFRHKELLTTYAQGMICGLGLDGYSLAIEYHLLSPPSAVAI